jgi:hypothetical protein
MTEMYRTVVKAKAAAGEASRPDMRSLKQAALPTI